MAAFKRVATAAFCLLLLVACAATNSATESSPQVKASVEPPPPPAISPDALSKIVDPLLANINLGQSVGMAVVDVATGQLLYDTGGTFVPASTAKLFTGAALLLTFDSKIPVTTKDGKSVDLGTELGRVLAESDNEGAKALAKLLPKPATEMLIFELPELDLSETVLVDPAGLSRKNKTSPRALASLLALAWNNPRLAALVAGLPVSGESGTMKKRAVNEPGSLLAKTGTLSGVNALAGIFQTSAGRAISFAILADAVPIEPGGTDKARKAIDQIATALVNAN